MKIHLHIILNTLVFLLLLPFLNNAQNLVLYTTLDDASSITSPSTGPAGTQNGGGFSAAQYNDGFLSDASNEYVTFDIGASTGTELNKLNQNKGTISFWYKPNFNSGIDGTRYFLSIGTFSSPYNNVIYVSYSVDFGDGGLKLFINGSNKVVDDLSSTSWSAGDLIHVAVVWDASGSNSDIDGGNATAIYINGSVTVSDNNTWTPLRTDGTDFIIGRSGNGQLYAGGVIDDIYVYDDVLTSTQINSLKDSQVLPVELTSFSANLFENSVKLNWATATEVNNYGFEIERRTEEVNGRRDEWENIGFVNGHGNSNSPKYYSFTEKNAPSGELQYRLKQIDFDGAFEYSDVVSINNSTNYKFDLAQNYPNPFNPTTLINYSIASAGQITIIVYDILGREVKTLVNKYQQKGNYKIEFDASQFSSGIYFYRLFVNDFIETKKMLLIK